MSSEWWKESFDYSYAAFNTVFCRILSVVTVLRLVLHVFFANPQVFSPPDRPILMCILFIAFLLRYVEHFSHRNKRLYLFFLLEFMNITCLVASETSYKSQQRLLLLESTVLTLFVQANIFESIYASFFIMVKHIGYWFLVNILVSGESTYLPITIGMSGAICSLWVMFEKSRKMYLRENYLTKEAIKKSSNQINEILRLFSDGLLIIDKEFKIKYNNEKILGILQTTPQNINEKLATVQTSNSINLHDVIMKMPWQNNNVLAFVGVTCIGGLRYEWTAKFVDWDDELCCMIVVKDVTALLTLERIEAQDKAKTQLIRSISHELRTPINGIIVLHDEIIEKIPEEVKEQFSMIKICAELLNFQISDILDYSQLISNSLTLNKAVCNIKEGLKYCCSLFKVQANHKRLRLKCIIDPSIPEQCFTDAFRVQKIVMNLLSNAIKYTNRGTVELCAINSGSVIKIIVRDTGIGIHEERLAYIFQMFSNNLDSGMSGLGLHISDNILKLAGSKLAATSKIGKGSTFYFSLEAFQNIPRFELSGEIDIPIEIINETIVPKSSFRDSSKISPKILIVDDNDFNRIVLGNILKKYKINYIEAQNGEIAVETVLKYDKSTPIECVIMDCNMPVLDGWDATRKIINCYTQGILKKLPAIIGHTAYSSNEDIQRCYQSGMISHFLKPTSEKEFMEIIIKYT